MDKFNPTIGYFKYKGVYGDMARQSRLNQVCKLMSNNFSVVTEFNYKSGYVQPRRFVWSNVMRLIKKGLVKTLVLSELSDAEVDPDKFVDFILFLKSRGIRLISLKEGFDSKSQGHFYAFQLHNPIPKERKFYEQAA